MNQKTLFLQSKQLDWLGYLNPPEEANIPTGIIWKLSKCVCVWPDASKSWYQTLRKELMKSGAVASKYDLAVFTWYLGNKLQGVTAVQVDDFCFAGSAIFQAKVINRLCHEFAVKSEEVVEFQYIRLDIKKNGETIKLEQNEYKKKLIF